MRPAFEHLKALVQGYQYQPLAQGDMIRLIKLTHPEDPIMMGGRKPITCSLVHVSLADSPEYETVSYSWGGQEATETIFCNGALFKVTKNLYAVLASLRRKMWDGLLWVDGICINQQDVEEKNQQVSMMRTIYQRSGRVNIYLGEAADNSDKGFHFMDKLLSASRRFASSGDTPNAPSMSSKELTDYFGVRAVLDDCIAGFSAITRRQWFERAWIIQEVAASPQVELRCGLSSIDWDDFVRAVEYSLEIGIMLLYPQGSLERVLSIQSTRQEFQSSACDTGPAGQGMDLERLLFRHRASNSTDPRDMVYALLGLSNNSGPDQLNLRVDYHLDKLEVYKELAIAILTAKCNLDFLGACVARKEEYTDAAQPLALPSWVPDLSTPEKPLALMLQGLPQEQYVHYAAAKSHLHYSPIFSADKSQLCLDGFLIDEISMLGLYLPRYQPTATISLMKFMRDIHHGLTISRNWAKITSARSPNLQYITGEPMLDAFWQTLICGRVEPEGYATAREMFYKIEESNATLVYLTSFILPPFWLMVLAVLALGVIQVVKGLCGGVRELEVKAVPMEFVRKGIHSSSTKWTIVKTAAGYIGMVPITAQTGDRIGLFKGGKVPLILRQVGDGSSWQLIGECYIHGVMQGEAFEEGNCEKIWIS